MFNQSLLVRGGWIGILFEVEEEASHEKKQKRTWYNGKILTVTEVKPAQEFDVRVEFSDGADEGPWSLKADHYDIRHANEKKNITEDVIVWRLYDKKPNVLTEDYYEHKSDKRPLDKKPEGNKKSGSERLAKKAKNVERSDVDVDSVLKGVQLEIKSLRDDVDNLKKKAKELQDTQSTNKLSIF